MKLRSKCFGFKIKAKNYIPKNEIWFCSRGKIVGKIINIKEPTEIEEKKEE